MLYDVRSKRRSEVEVAARIGGGSRSIRSEVKCRILKHAIKRTEVRWKYDEVGDGV